MDPSVVETLIDSGPLGAVVIVLFSVIAFLTKRLLKAKDDQIRHVTEFSERLVAQSSHIQELVREHNRYYEALARETESNTRAVRSAIKTVEAHAFASSSVDKSKFIAIRGGRGTE